MNKSINMCSSADDVKGQGVGSAYDEQVRLVKEKLGDDYNISINKVKFADIMHYHTINLEYFLTLPFTKIHSMAVGYVHFLPETLENSIKLPTFAKKVFYKYVIEFYKSMDYLVTVNPYFIEKLVGYGIDREKITYIPNYVSDEDFYKIKDKNIINNTKAKYGIDKNKFVVLSVGQLQTRKGFWDFLEVAKEMPEVEFVWAGGFSFKNISDGYEEIKKAVDNPLPNTKFLGIVPREEMNMLYNASDVMFLASFEELFPMTVLEASNVGKPILLRDVELYKGILDGCYLKGNSVQEFKNIIEKLEKDECYYSKAVQMSKLCAKTYSKDTVGKMWKSYYNKIYNQGKKRREKYTLKNLIKNI